VRILEPEAMMSLDEVIAYDLLANKYLHILHAGFIETVINLSPPQGIFLDVGTGTGRIAIGVAKYNPDIKIIGVDLSETMLNVAEKNAREEGVNERIRFMKGDAKCLPFDPVSFDSVFCHNMLHHLSEPMSLVEEMLRVVKRDGAVIIRDLKRHSRIVTELHVNILGLPYNKLMKKEYRDSIRAALSAEEWEEILRRVTVPGVRLTKQFITHMSIERPSSRKRKDYIKVPAPFYMKPFKRFFVSYYKK
jgi:ubiquinone/menaquinone biosynthesis C-methylase UbiE